MRVTRSISPKSIIDKINRLFNNRKISDDDILEYIGEAMEHCYCFLYEDNVITFVEVDEYQAPIPFGVTEINQLALNLEWTPETKKDYCPEKVTQEISDELDVIDYDSCGRPIRPEIYYSNVSYNFGTQNPYFWDLSYFVSNFVPIRRSNNLFFDYLVREIDRKSDMETFSLRHGDLPQYQVTQGDALLTFDFKEGQVAISHNRIALDEDGFPMIPDHPEIKDTIFYFIVFKIMERDFYNNDQGSVSRLQKAEQDFEFACSSTRNLKLPDMDGLQNILEHSKSLVPNHHKFANFFSTLGNRPIRR